MEARSLTSSSCVTTPQTTEGSMRQETSKRERQYCMCQRNKSLLSKWLSTHQLEKRCTKRVWDNDSYHQSTPSCQPSLCRKDAKKIQNGTCTLISCPNHSRTSPYSTPRRKNCSWLAVLSWTRLTRRSRTSSRTMIWSAKRSLSILRDPHDGFQQNLWYSGGGRQNRWLCGLCWHAQPQETSIDNLELHWWEEGLHHRINGRHQKRRPNLWQLWEEVQQQIPAQLWL